MSFKTKTILVLTALGLVPYVITMVFLGNTYREEYIERIHSDMEYKLAITVDRLDQSLKTLEDDLRFMASLDVMDDVLTEDLDHRIFKLISKKKEDLQMAGDFYAIDTEGMIVASSDMKSVGTRFSLEPFLEVPLMASFDQRVLGKLVAVYELENLKRMFADGESQSYRLYNSEDSGLLPEAEDAVLFVHQALQQRPQLSVGLMQSKSFALAVLDHVTHGFYFALLVGTLVLACIAYACSRYILHPILLLASTARGISETGDYSKRVDIYRRDEIGQLASAFNSMIASIQDMIRRLNEESENRLKLAQEKERAEMLQNLSNKLSKYLSPQVYNSIFSGKSDVTLNASRKKLTVFFSDIVNFTSTTDEMESEDLTQLLNSYLREMTDIALHYGATVDKYIGDAIMIFFGDPDSQGVGRDACLCVEMSLAMQKRTQELQEAWRKEGFTKPFSIRVGIHTGYCTVGNFGTENRMDYTIIGSTVNQASRIESSAEPGTIYISEDTYLLVRERFDCFPVNQVMLKGLSKPIKLYRVEMEGRGDDIISVSEAGFELQLLPGKLTDESLNRMRTLLDTYSKDQS